MAVGGTNHFPDGFITGNQKKPWGESDNKMKLNFANAKNEWGQTWSDPAMKVDYIRIKAL